jgi:hypothetical protein
MVPAFAQPDMLGWNGSRWRLARICSSIHGFQTLFRLPDGAQSAAPPLFEEAFVQYGLTREWLHILRAWSGDSIREIRYNDMPLRGTLIEQRDIAEGGRLMITTD